MRKEPLTEYDCQADTFRRKLLLQTLTAHHGNRTRAARALGLQRTYLLRLIRHFQINVPPRNQGSQNGTGE